jgi:hypothetical protein
MNLRKRILNVLIHAIDTPWGQLLRVLTHDRYEHYGVTSHLLELSRCCGVSDIKERHTRNWGMQSILLRRSVNSFV